MAEKSLIIKILADGREARKEIQRTRQEIDEMFQKRGKDPSGFLGTMAKETSGLEIGLRRVAPYIDDVIAGAEKAAELSEFAHKYNTDMGAVGSEKLNAIREATRGLVDDVTLLGIAAKASSGDFQLTADQMKTVANAAMVLSGQGFGPVAQVFEKLTTALRKGEMGSLSEYGIIMEGVTGKANQFNVALNKMGELHEKNAASANKAGTATQRMAVSVKNDVDSLKRTAGNVVEFGAKVNEFFGDAVQSTAKRALRMALPVVEVYNTAAWTWEKGKGALVGLGLAGDRLAPVLERVVQRAQAGINPHSMLTDAVRSLGGAYSTSLIPALRDALKWGKDWYDLGERLRKQADEDRKHLREQDAKRDKDRRDKEKAAVEEARKRERDWRNDLERMDKEMADIAFQRSQREAEIESERLRRWQKLIEYQRQALANVRAYLDAQPATGIDLAERVGMLDQMKDNSLAGILGLKGGSRDDPFARLRDSLTSYTDKMVQAQKHLSLLGQVGADAFGMLITGQEGAGQAAADAIKSFLQAEAVRAMALSLESLGLAAFNAAIGNLPGAAAALKAAGIFAAFAAAYGLGAAIAGPTSGQEASAARGDTGRSTAGRDTLGQSGGQQKVEIHVNVGSGFIGSPRELARALNTAITQGALRGYTSPQGAVKRA